MPRQATRLVILMVLLICVWGHLSELADHWDHTLQSGADSEYSLILLALTAGVALAVSLQLVGRQSRCSEMVLVPACARPHSAAPSNFITVTDSSPPLSLRI